MYDRENIRHFVDVGLMIGRHLRRCANIEPELSQHPVLMSLCEDTVTHTRSVCTKRIVTETFVVLPVTFSKQISNSFISTFIVQFNEINQ